MAYKGRFKIARSLIAGALTRLFVVIAPRAAVTMTATGGGIGYQSQVIDLSLPAVEHPVQSNAALEAIDEVPEDAHSTLVDDLRGTLPANGVYPARDPATITTRYWHHTATGDNATWAAIAKGHVQGRGWAGIGYHMGIDKDGRIALLNPLSRITNHTANHNSKGVGVVLLGNYDVSRPSEAMQASIERVRAYMDEKGIRAEHWHRETKSTACPGRYAVEYLDRTRDR